MFRLTVWILYHNIYEFLVNEIIEFVPDIVYKTPILNVIRKIINKNCSYIRTKSDIKEIGYILAI